MTFRDVVVVVGIAVVLYGCGGDSSLATVVVKSVSLPLQERRIIRVGVREVPEDGGNPAFRWVQDAANVTLQFTPIEGRTSLLRLVVLGEMTVSDTAPDMVDLQAIPSELESLRKLFLNLLDYPESTPNLVALARSDPAFRDGLLQSLSAPRELHGMPQYSQGGKPFVGTLLFRADLFEQRGLRWDTWEQLYDSLQQLKASFPRAGRSASPATTCSIVPRPGSAAGTTARWSPTITRSSSASVWGRGIRSIRTTCAGSLAHTATDCCT